MVRRAWSAVQGVCAHGYSGSSPGRAVHSDHWQRVEMPRRAPRWRPPARASLLVVVVCVLGAEHDNYLRHDSLTVGTHPADDVDARVFD